MLASRLAQVVTGSAPTASPSHGAWTTDAPDASRPDPHAVPSGPTELVTRPDGLRRGVWEGPSWVFGAIAAVLVVAVLLWGLRRLGFLGGRAK
jgi:hypothetical protein